jgi:hypothetical protein
MRRAGALLRSARQFRRDAGGAGTLEFVLTLPLFLVPLAFAVELGLFLVAHQDVVNNVRSAVRYLSRTDCTSTHQDRARNIVRTGHLLDEGSPPYPLIFDEGNLCPNNRVRISVLVHFPLSIWGLTGNQTPMIPFRVREDLPAGGG